ncbi:peptidase [Phreatobacter aquaticus]|uniref:Peptidase n=1 Tax=Phreatobacter aquaticus TaxID=2570229 RepID=A0A4D7QTL7_9HYPH|nr:peptidase [Phreatobacter aquaticus]QCK87352.1 peptidase [Phreatobacter aquaticus]
MTSESGSRSLFVSLGPQRYRVERPFGGFDRGRAVVSDVACDSRGHVYVLLRLDPLVDEPADPVIELDPQGRVVRSFGAKDVLDAHMLAVDPEDHIVVVDRDAHRLVTFTRDGTVIRRIGSPETPGEPFSHPSSVAFAADGSFYVADGYGASRVQHFSAAGDRIRSFGRRGKAPGEFSTPHGVWVDADGRVLVTDRENDRLQLFSADGQPLDAWPDLPRAMDVWSDADGSIFVTDQVPRLSRYDRDGNLVGSCRPVLNGAHGIWGDRSGNIFLAEINPSRITKLTPV